MFENILPIGTVVLLKKAAAKVMITGYKQVSSKDKSTVKDYAGVLYPIGSLGSKMTILFDVEDIQDIVFTGYKNSEFDDMVTTLEQAVKDDSELSETLKNKKIGS